MWCCIRVIVYSEPRNKPQIALSKLNTESILKVNLSKGHTWHRFCSSSYYRFFCSGALHFCVLGLIHMASLGLIQIQKVPTRAARRRFTYIECVVFVAHSRDSGRRPRIAVWEDALRRCAPSAAAAASPLARKSPSDPPPIGSDAVALIFQGCHSQIYFRNDTHHSFLQRSSRKVTCVSLINQIFSSYEAQTKNRHRVFNFNIDWIKQSCKLKLLPSNNGGFYIEIFIEIFSH